MTHSGGRSTSTVERLSKLAPAVGYIIAQIILIGYWGYVINEYGVDPTPDENPYPLGNFIVMAVLTGPPAAVLGFFDTIAQRSNYSLLKMLDGLLIIAFAGTWIVPATSFMLFLEPDIFGNVDIPSRPTYVGLFLGGEFALALLLILSMGIQWVTRRQSQDR